MSMRHLTGRLALAATLSLGLAPLAVGAAAADPGNGKAAHWNQEDGCNHGNSGKPCKDDPQPNNGKDCLTHGNWGGVNEDHCAPATEPGGGSEGGY